MLIAQMTDLHVRPEGKKAYIHVDTNTMAKACIEALCDVTPTPDVLLISGDLTDCGLAEEYALLRDILAPLPMPVYVIPGNHDRRERLRDAFFVDGYLPENSPFLHYVVEDNPVRLIALDTVVPGEGHGEMDDERLAWLERALDEGGDKPTLIFMHHPPFPTGIVHMDAIGCRNGGQMAALLSQYPNVERVLAGHHHRPVQVRWGGTIGMIVPSPAHQVLLDLNGDEDAARIKMEPPAFALHQFTPETGIISHQAYVGEFDGPWPFALDPDYPAFKGTPEPEAA